MDFRDALNSLIADLTPQPWDYTDSAGTTLTVIPAGLREDPGCAEVNIRVTRADATGLGGYGLTTPNSRGVAEVGVTTTGLPGLIEALAERTEWENAGLVAGMLAVVPVADGVIVRVTEVHAVNGQGQGVAVSMRLPETQRLPLASALRRALDVARGWEDPA